MTPRRPTIILISIIIPAILIVAYFALSRLGAFPELEPICDLPDGYTWIYKGEIEDFYTYHAISTDSTSEIGIYFGDHPNSQKREMKTTSEDQIGHFNITWNIDDSEWSAKKSYFRYCLFNYRHSWIYKSLKIYIWIVSYTPEENEKLLKSLKNLKFRIREYF